MSNQLIQFLNPYSKQVDLPSIGKPVEIKPITTGQMKKILSYEDGNDPFIIEDILDDIITGCVVNEWFNVDNITIQDRFTLIVEIRKITKGNTYTFNIECPKCRTELINSINLDELEFIPYPEKIDPIVKLTESLSVSMKYTTRDIQKEAIKLVNGIPNLTIEQKMAEMATYMYALSMETFYTPTGEITDASIEDKKELLDNLSEDVYENINEWYKKFDYGVKFKYQPLCRFCGWKNEEEDIPITGFFF